MPRLTERQQLALVRQTISAWKKRSDRPITINVLAVRTGLSFRRCETLSTQYHLNVRRNARETQEALSDDYCGAVEGFRDWCEERSANFRSAMVAAMRSFMARRA